MNNILLEANTFLSKKLVEVKNEKDRLWYEVQKLTDRVKYLEKAYENKMKVAGIILEDDHMSCILKITESTQTPDGLFIVAKMA